MKIYTEEEERQHLRMDRVFGWLWGAVIVWVLLLIIAFV
jgi:hypothetical protein